MDEGVKEQEMPTTKPENHEQEHEIITKGQNNMQTEEGLTKDNETHPELTKVSFPFPMSSLIF